MNQRDVIDSPTWRVLPLVFLVAAPLLLACAEEEIELESGELLGESRCQELKLAAPPPDSNIIIFLNDTMRRDVMSAYGGAASTPKFDRFAGGHLLFQNVSTQAPWTKPSIATLFTSLYPSQHGVASDPVLHEMLERHGLLREMREREDATQIIETDRLGDSFETLAEVLSASGFRTAAFTSNPWMAKSFGFGQGFEIYDDSFANWGTTGDDVIAAALGWIESLDPSERYFLYLHTIDSHRPYAMLRKKNLPAMRARFGSEPELESLDAIGITATIRFDDGRTAPQVGLRPTKGLISAAYEAGIESFDKKLGKFLKAVSKTGGYDRTAIIVTSDHGEALFDRGYGNHGGGLFDDENAIPFAARFPGVIPAQGEIGCLVGLIDVMPSLCEYVGVSCGERVQGWSFFSSGDSPDANLPIERRFLVTEGIMFKPRNRSIRNRRFKLIHEPDGHRPGSSGNGAWSLYDIAADANEEFDHLSKAQGSRLGEIVLEALRDEVPRAVAIIETPEPERVEMSPEVKARLEALGYAE